MWILVLLLLQTTPAEVLRTRIGPELPPPLSTGPIADLRLKLAGGDAEAETAVEAALRRLAVAQRADGAWSEGDEVQTTALALLAFAGAGYGPRSERHGVVIRRGLGFLIGRQDVHGSWGPDTRRQAIATCALRDLYRRHRSPILEGPLLLARESLWARRDPDGTWGDAAVQGWVRLAGDNVFGLPKRWPLEMPFSVEHEALVAWNRGADAWRRWLDAARPRLLGEAVGIAATARQAIDLGTPYRWVDWTGRTWGARSGL